MTTYDENGGYPHPDHVMCHKSRWTAWAAGRPAAYPEPASHGSRSSSTTTTASTARGQPCTRRCSARARVALRRAAQEWSPTRLRRADHHAGAVRGVLPGPRPGAASPTPPRSIRTVRGSVPLDVHQAVWPTEDFELVRRSSPELPRGRPVRWDQGTCDTGLMNSVVLLVSGLASHLVALADKVPSDDQIGAGWWYFLLFVALAGAVTFLGFSLSKQLRKTRTNAPRARRVRRPRQARPLTSPSWSCGSRSRSVTSSDCAGPTATSSPLPCLRRRGPGPS